MKTETEIAEGNVKLYGTNTHYCSQEHKQSCQRFLEFLEDDDMCPARFSGNYSSGLEIFEDKIIDLKKAIEIYEGHGI